MSPTSTVPQTVAPQKAALSRVSQLVIGLTVLLLFSLVCGCALGAANIPFGQVMRILGADITGGTLPASDAGAYNIVVELRLPRTLLAAIVGAGLSIVGVVVQAIVRNVLADPFVLGISSGASVGAASVTVLGLFAALGVYAVSLAAFVGAMAATVVVYVVARTRGGFTPLRLVLVGTALSYGFSAMTTLLVFTAPNADAARSVLFWLMGSLSGVSWPKVPLAASVVVVGGIALMCSARALNALAMGDETAATLGVPANRVRGTLFGICAVMTGAMVAVSGAIGFVGLMVPHALRLIVGAEHRRVLAVAPVAGAVFLTWVDIASRLIVAPEELPIGAITALLGVPTFLLLLRRRRRVVGV